MSGGGHEDSGFVPRRFVLGQFVGAEALLGATRKMREKGHKGLDTHSPYPLHGGEEALGLGRPKIPAIVLFGAIVGASLAYAMMYYMNAYDWPINVANRPPHSSPAMIPITFEVTVLLAGSASFFGVLALLGLPKPYHPLFEAESFRLASVDSFFLSAEVPADKNAEDVAADMRTLGGQDVQIIEESER
jgi:hypothetical protein